MLAVGEDSSSGRVLGSLGWVVLGSRAQHRGDGLQGIPFKPIVHEDERASLRASLDAFPDERCARSPGVRIRIFDIVVRFKELDRLLVAAAGLEQKAGRTQLWIGAAAFEPHLLAHSSVQELKMCAT